MDPSEFSRLPAEMRLRVLSNFKKDRVVHEYFGKDR